MVTFFALEMAGGVLQIHVHAAVIEEELHIGQRFRLA